MFAASKTASVSGGYQISRSLRFNRADSAYLSRTPASNGNLTNWTWSAWVKRSGLGTAQNLLSVYTGNASDTGLFSFGFNTSDKFTIDGYSLNWRVTTQVFRDVSAWYHIVVAFDTTLATAGDRIKFYINGSQVTTFDTTNNPTQNQGYPVNTGSVAHYMSLNSFTGSGNCVDGYMTEINFVNAQQLTPSSFGETNAQTGVWQPKAFAGTYGTNGFYLNFSDNSNTTAATLGKDYSGNGNNWTPNNFSVTAGAGNDSLVDSPTSYGVDTGVGGSVRGNYCTMNPLKNNSNNVLSNGNLTIVNSVASTSLSFGTIAYPKTDKYYFEALASANAGTTANQIGIASTNHETTQTGSKRYWYIESGFLYDDGTQVQTVSSFTAGDVIACAYNADANTVTWYKNNTQQGTPISVSTSYDYVPVLSIYKGQWDVNFGQRPFAYTAPSGFKALCTQNLPTPTIGATTATQAGKYFNPVLYTGNGSSTQTITGVGFQPDWVWTKSRSNTSNHSLVDSVRGGTQLLISELTDSEYTGTWINSFNSDGYVLGSNSTNSNASGYTYVSWNWRASNATAVTNTAGSITSTVSANTTSGFSVVTYTGNGSTSATIGHGLGVAPKMYIVKCRSNTGFWPVWHTSLYAQNQATYIALNYDSASNVYDGVFTTNGPTSTTFAIGSDINANGNTFVAYCFAEVAGYSKFGSYTGNGSTDGPFVFTGMRPAYVLIKKTNAADEWFVWDSKRSTINQITGGYLAPNRTSAEGTTEAVMDLVSNGFKIRGTNTSWNLNGATYIFACFAESPFKYSLAR